METAIKNSTALIHQRRRKNHLFHVKNSTKFSLWNFNMNRSQKNLQCEISKTFRTIPTTSCAIHSHLVDIKFNHFDTSKPLIFELLFWRILHLYGLEVMDPYSLHFSRKRKEFDAFAKVCIVLITSCTTYSCTGQYHQKVLMTQLLATPIFTCLSWRCKSSGKKFTTRELNERESYQTYTDSCLFAAIDFAVVVRLKRFIWGSFEGNS